MNPQLIGKMIRFHRRKSGLSQAELGHLAQVGKTAVYDIEKGKITIRLLTLLKLLKVLNITMSFRSPLMELFENEKS